MINHFFILLLYLLKCSSENVDAAAQNHLKIVQAGDKVTFTCFYPKELRTTVVWVKQKAGEKPLSIASSYQALAVVFENGFDKHNRFSVAKDDSSFNLSITNAKESDTATYYCAKFIYQFIFEEATDLIVKDRELNMQSEHKTPITDPVHPEDSAVALQCTVLTQSCAGEHNVYWFRRESGESPPGIIFTQERRNAQCERRSDVNSTAHKCIYSLPKRNLSLSDAGIYYCAVAACGEILFGDARKPDMPGFQEPWSIIALILGTLNCLSVIVIIFLCTQLYTQLQKDKTQNIQIGHLMDEEREALNYAALSFQQKSSARRPREKHTR
ncbi:novel immune-type receptor 2b [Carassius carassius]|uniref:novel immune-type receptor 2b n=1 Tax=Carassius carassius TaxID=217509 RepID=UPI002868F7B6|nr:novel immune-type receptor 2b [Carassius carassius]XP_059382439.1 novel immune-type receptor 2b [Carassius carassius]